MIFSNNEINNWYKSKIGKLTLNKIINYLSNSIRVDYNQKIIVHGCDNFLKSLKNILTSKNIFFIHNNNRYDLSTSIYKLPFEDNSIDTVILFHSIDFSKNPHNVFREVDRILKDDGEIILISFNIYSLLLVKNNEKNNEIITIIFLLFGEKILNFFESINIAGYIHKMGKIGNINLISFVDIKLIIR